MRHGDHANGYVILDEIGEGGMSIVYLARDHRTQKQGGRKATEGTTRD